MSATIGRPVARVDGPAKVTGAARYSAEIALPGLVHAVLVGATVPSGRITAIDTRRAEAAGGVLAVLTHRNLGPVADRQPVLIPSLGGGPCPGQTFFPMLDETVHYAGQHIAIVVADTLDRAEHAAELVSVAYEETPSVTTVEQGRAQAYVPERIFGGWMPGRASRGDVEAGLAQASVRVDSTYRCAANHHNPIETSATTARWDGDLLTLWDSTQGPNATQLTVAAQLGLSLSRVRVVSSFVGGSFGSKAMIWDHAALAALAARHVGAPVRLALTREQMFSSTGHREEQEHHIVLGAGDDGRLTAVRHHKTSVTSPFDDWADPALACSSGAYACPNYENAYRLVRGNTITPTFTRAPGESAGMFVLETAMDELADALGLDPIELRLRNHADVDPESGNPWSSKGLKECYARGAELFGWDGRDPRPGTRREGRLLIGTGMASAIYPVAPVMTPQRARARLYDDGRAVVQSSFADFGTGAATAMTQVAADALGIAVEAVRFEYGDTALPSTVAAVGSAGAGVVSAGVHTAAVQLREQVIARAVSDTGSPLHGADPAGIVVLDGCMALRDAPATGETYAEFLGRNHLTDVEATGTWTPPPSDRYAAATFGAQFAEVAVDPDLGTVRVRRMTGVFAPGRVLNRTMAHSQLMGGMLWGLGQALLEATHMDPAQGRWANPSLGDYLVPVNADAPDVQVDTIEVQDDVVNPLGVKGVGEIGMVGAAAAIANAVFHATGRRVHKLPITIEDLL
ncbi:xanthine dehydrogenase family protein molybdopterin-binding subunit [Actinomadura rugatobispora]|uniref:Xanthine dehydrogenase family protein molybdopterin-binding subunit n=1 Tax=Actinomadura rugatobispora TaxID=1994 RepID=A0ABW1A1L8_9ACTN|nr:xanthine dehydrogenase family protein molybdopterin-binding subunit [Actinomadura rugatobispora]